MTCYYFYTSVSARIRSERFEGERESPFTSSMLVVGIERRKKRKRKSQEKIKYFQQAKKIEFSYRSETPTRFSKNRNRRIERNIFTFPSSRAPHLSTLTSFSYSSRARRWEKRKEKPDRDGPHWGSRKIAHRSVNSTRLSTAACTFSDFFSALTRHLIESRRWKNSSQDDVQFSFNFDIGELQLPEQDQVAQQSEILLVLKKEKKRKLAAPLIPLAKELQFV